MLKRYHCTQHYLSQEDEKVCNYYYRPQRSWAKVIFSQACVKNSVHRGRVSASVHAGMHQPPPPQQTPYPPSRTRPPPPRSRHPLWEQTPTRSRPPQEADCSIRSTSGRYASYWNAFLFSFTNAMYTKNEIIPQPSK